MIKGLASSLRLSIVSRSVNFFFSDGDKSRVGRSIPYRPAASGNFGKAQPTVPHQKTENIPPGPTTKTVIYQLFRTHRERRRFFCVERAQALVIPAGPTQSNNVGHDIDDIGRVLDRCNFVFRDVRRQENPPPFQMDSGSIVSGWTRATHETVVGQRTELTVECVPEQRIDVHSHCVHRRKPFFKFSTLKRSF